jgi:hypothetical protein
MRSVVRRVEGTLHASPLRRTAGRSQLVGDRLALASHPIDPRISSLSVRAATVGVTAVWGLGTASGPDRFSLRLPRSWHAVTQDSLPEHLCRRQSKHCVRARATARPIVHPAFQLQSTLRLGAAAAMSDSCRSRTGPMTRSVTCRPFILLAPILARGFIRHACVSSVPAAAA